MIVNGALGYVLWSTYSSTSELLEPHLPNSPICVAALSGAVAGGAQALVAAPAENVRLAVEGGSTSARGWSHAWKEVFRGTRTAGTQSRIDEVHEARQVRDWMREVGEMAGRGWDGWAWGCAKDICGTPRPTYLPCSFPTLTMVFRASTLRLCDFLLHLRIDKTRCYSRQERNADHDAVI